MNTASSAPILRKWVGDSRPGLRMNDVPRVAHRHDQRGGLAVETDLAPQVADMHVDHIRVDVEVVVPGGFEQHRARDDLAGVSHHEFEQLVFTRLEVDGLTRAAHYSGGRI